MPKTTLKPGTTYQQEGGKTYIVTVQEVADLTTQRPKRKIRKPYKKVLKLFSKPDPNDDEQVVQYNVPLYPSGLVKHADRITYKPKRKTALSCTVGYFVPRVEIDYQHAPGIWVGATQYPSGSDDACRFWTLDENATAESILEKILCLPSTGFGPYTEQGGWNSGMQHETDSEHIIVSSDVWRRLSKELRKRFLREVFADTIYIDVGLE